MIFHVIYPLEVQKARIGRNINVKSRTIAGGFSGKTHLITGWYLHGLECNRIIRVPKHGQFGTET